MSIRKLFLLSNTEIIAKIFKGLPAEVKCFCPYSDYRLRLVSSPYNAFDNGLAFEQFKENFNFNKFSIDGNKKLFEFDDLIHILVIRLGNKKKVFCDHKDSELKIIKTIKKEILPNNVFLKSFGMIGEKYPIIQYRSSVKDLANGFVIYRNLESIEEAIAYQSERKHKEAEENYSKLIKIARKKLFV